MTPEPTPTPTPTPDVIDPSALTQLVPLYVSDYAVTGMLVGIGLCVLLLCVLVAQAWRSGV